MAFFFEAFGHGFDAQRVPYFERAKFPAESPAHGAVYVGDGVRDFRDASGGVEAGLRRLRTREIAGLCRRSGAVFFALSAASTGASIARRRSRVSSMGRAISIEGKRAFCRARYSIVAGSSVRISDVVAFAFFDALVETLTGLFTEPAAAYHILYEGRQDVDAAGSRRQGRCRKYFE